MTPTQSMVYVLLILAVIAAGIAIMAGRAAQRRARTRKAMGALLARSYQAAQSEQSTPPAEQGKSAPSKRRSH